MFFFYSVHNKNQTELPAIYAQTHFFVSFKPIPISLVSFVAMNVLNYHHNIIIFENQWIVINKSFKIPIQFVVWLLQHLLIKVVHQRRMQMILTLRLSAIFQITDNHRLKRRDVPWHVSTSDILSVNFYLLTNFTTALFILTK